MNQFIAWLSMGGYASYIWTAYGLVAAVLIINGLSIKFQRQRTIKKLEQWFKRQSL